MTIERWITELGMGADLHGRDYTSAARRAVSDALRHSSLAFFGPAGKSPHDMVIEVRIAVARPEAVDVAAVAAELPYGHVSVTVVPGGLDVAAPSGDDAIVVANAAILVGFAASTHS